MSTHDGPRPIAEARGDQAPRSLWGRGASRIVGRLGEAETRDSSPGRKPCFTTGSASVASNRTFPASCKLKEGGKKETTSKTEKEGIWCLEVQLVHLYTYVVYLAKDHFISENREKGLGVLLSKFQITETPTNWNKKRFTSSLKRPQRWQILTARSR